MVKVESYGDALTQADRVERRERRRAGDVRKVTHQLLLQRFIRKEAVYLTYECI
jgi:hypothetical protein